MEAVNFSDLPKEQPVDHMRWDVVSPSAPLMPGGSVEFVMQGTDAPYLDLQKSRLRVQLKIVKSDDGDIKLENVAFVNLPLQTLWKEVKVYWQNRPVSTGQLYPYKAMIDTLLSYGDAAKDSQLKVQGYHKDAAGFMDEAVTAGRKTLTENGKSVQLEGPLMSDVCQQPFLVPNGVQVKIKLVPHGPAFALHSTVANAAFKVKVEDVKFLACLVTLNPAHQAKIEERLKKTTLKYPLQVAEMYNIPLIKGTPRAKKDDLFDGRVPSRMVVGLVNSEAFEGNYKKNPFNFQHYNVNSVDVSVNGAAVPQGPLELNFAENLIAPAYTALYSVVGGVGEDFGNGITPADFAKGYALYAFDFDPAIQREELKPVAKAGNVKLDIGFTKALTETAQLIVYAQFPTVLEIDDSRNVTFP